MLHIINHHRHLSEALRYACSGDSILLVEDAIYAAIPAHKAYALLRESELTFFLLSPDAIARAIPLIMVKQIQPVDFAGFVDLTVENPQSMTWA